MAKEMRWNRTTSLSSATTVRNGITFRQFTGHCWDCETRHTYDPIPVTEMEAIDIAWNEGMQWTVNHMCRAQGKMARKVEKIRRLPMAATPMNMPRAA